MPCGFSPRAAALVAAALQRESQAKLARRLGCSAAVLSQLRRGSYPPANADHWNARVIDRLDGVDCPVLGRLATAACEKFRARAMPMSDPAALRLWRACQNCPEIKPEIKEDLR